MLLTAAANYSQEINILEHYNGDFEDGTTFWRFFEVPNNIGSTLEIVGDAVSGSKAIKISYVAADASIQDRGFDNWSAGVPVLAGAAYTLKASMKSDQASGLKLKCLVGFFTSSKTVIHPQYVQGFALTDSYTEHEFSVTAPEGASTCWVAFRMYDESNQRAAGTMYLDNVKLMGLSTALSPRVMTTTLPSEDVPIASIDVTEEPYAAKNDGSEDATASIQDAIDRASVAGGAVVFIPAGSYRLDGHLHIPERVVLRGEWENPDSVGGVSGTVLMPYEGKGSDAGDPFISIHRGAGIKNLSIWYPEQTSSTVYPYPWTIHCHPDGTAGAGDNTSVINVSLVNAYNGIKIGPNWNELHYIRNVYGTPLNQGIWLSQTTDIGRIMNVHFEPKYWSGSGLSDAPSQDAILAYLQNSTSKGIIMGRSDWEYIYDVSLVGYQTGMEIIKYTDSGPNGVVYGLRIEKSKIGIDLVNLNPIGWAISNATIEVEGENSVCIRAGSSFNSVVQFNTCSFGGDPETAVLFSDYSTGRLSFQNCTFENWGQSGDGPAIDCTKGSLSLLGNTFNLDKLHLRLGDGVQNTQVLDNTFPSALKMDNQSSNEIIVSQEPLNLSGQKVPSHLYAAVPRPAKDDLYDIMDYGAIADGSTDNSTAIQAALNDAGLNGGGTVYIPAGMYKVSSHLIVPSGVELRGIYDVPHHTISRGSVLLAYEGKGNPAGTPFISLETGSGVRGFTVWYPEQSSQEFFPYPWSVRTLGEYCWVKDVCLANTYQGVDMASYPSGSHMISYLGAAPLKTGIFVDQSTGDGWIENVQFNPHYWVRSPGYPRSTELDINTIIPYQQANLEAFKLASATNEHVVGTFVFAAKYGFYLAPDNGSSRVDIIQHGTDAGDNAIYLENKAGSKVNFVNTQLVLLGKTQTGIITTAPKFDADVSFYNSISWGGPGPSTYLNGSGNLLIQQMHSRNNTFKINNGKTRFENIAISSNPNPQYIVGEGTDDFKLYGSYTGNGFEIYDYVEDRSTVEIDYVYRLNRKETSFATGWESGENQNTWDHTLFGNKDIEIGDSAAFYCEALDTDTAHNSLRALRIVGSKLEGATPSFKIFDERISILNNSTFSYWINPQNEAGKTGHVDFLFTDGTRLSELSPLAEDGLLLNAPRGSIGGWTEVRCSLWKYATGKNIQTVLVQADLVAEETYRFFMDDLTMSEVVSVDPSVSDHQGLSLHQNSPNPFSLNTSISYTLDQSGLVTLSVYDILGRRITTLINEKYQQTGRHEMSWTPATPEAGIYFCRLEFLSDSGTKSVVNRKMIIAE